MKQTFVLHAGDPERSRILANCAAFLGKLTAAKSWEVTIKLYRKTRSSEQNKALWGVAYPAIVAATGQEAEDWHAYFLGEWFGWQEYTLFGRKKVKPKRTTTTGFDGEPNTLSTVEFAEFYAFIQMRCAQNGIYVPDPDPFWREQRAAA